MFPENRSSPPQKGQPTIFLSHAIDDPQWTDGQVIELGQALQSKGFTVLLDIFRKNENASRLSDHEWRIWMAHSFRQADFWICLSSTHYVHRASIEQDKIGGKGVAFELFEIEQWLYDQRQISNGRVIVCTQGAGEIPPQLRGRAPVFKFPNERQDLFSHLLSLSETPQQKIRKSILNRHIEEECVGLYVRLSGMQKSESIIDLSTRIPMATRQRIATNPQKFTTTDAKNHEDILDAIRSNTRAVLLGDPGAGKTFALLKIIENDLRSGGYPLYVRLNRWLTPNQNFVDFVASEASDLGAEWEDFVEYRQIGKLGHEVPNCRLLLDGLNEISPESSIDRTAQICNWIDSHTTASVIISCRSEELPSAVLRTLRETLTLEPMRARQVRQFVQNYLPPEIPDGGAFATRLFWHLAGGDRFRDLWEGRPESTAEHDLDGLVDGREMPKWLSADDASELALIRGSTEWPFPLSSNPYLLAMILWAWSEDQMLSEQAKLPRRRVEVFDKYTHERIIGELQKRHSSITAEDVQDFLSSFAAELQHIAEREHHSADIPYDSFLIVGQVESKLGAVFEASTRYDKNRDRDAKSSIEAGNLAIHKSHIDPDKSEALDIAVGALLVRSDGDHYRFRHQLLHEFYVARYIHGLLTAGDGAIDKIWGEREVWQRSGWIQPFLLLVEFQQEDAIKLLDILLDVQPEAAAAEWEHLRLTSSTLIDDQIAERVKERLTARMLPPEMSTEFPRLEAAYGRALGRMRMPDGSPMDKRSGVWGHYSKQTNRTNIDIEWIKVCAGKFYFQGQESSIRRSFHISKFPITYSQYMAFVEDPGGWDNPKWRGRFSGRSFRREYRPTKRINNSPCTEVSLYMAEAFCRWLSSHMQCAVRLPTEEEWERAASGTTGRQFPWGTDAEGMCNSYQELDDTSAVGIFQDALSEEGVMDLSGNVREWTSTRYCFGHRGNLSRIVSLALWPIVPACRWFASRGGSWMTHRFHCSSSSCDWYLPDEETIISDFEL